MSNISDELQEHLDTLVHNAILYGRGKEHDITDIQTSTHQDILNLIEKQTTEAYKKGDIDGGIEQINGGGDNE